MSTQSSQKTVLITGASSGIGKATAHYFAQQGWNVIATMRSPEKSDDLAAHKNITCLPLDVSKPETITPTIQKALQQFGTIDVVVNNAGYAALGLLEAVTEDDMQRQFDVNVYGIIRVMQAILPHFRAQNSGTIINVSSVVGRVTVPLYSLYTASKWAVEGLTESVQYELHPFNIRVKLVEPGAVKTDFWGRSMQFMKSDHLTDYAAFMQRNQPSEHDGDKGSSPEHIAKVIFRAATDSSNRLRYAAGRDARWILRARKLLPDRIFNTLVRLTQVQ